MSRRPINRRQIHTEPPEVLLPPLFLSSPLKAFHARLEAAFKCLKSDLGIRPIHHQLEHRVDAHILVAFLAYCLTVTLKYRLQAHAPGLTPRAVLEN